MLADILYFFTHHWLGIGIVYLLVLTRGLTKAPPEMTAIAEAE